MQKIHSVRGCTVPPGGWPQIQMEEAFLHHAQEVLSCDEKFKAGMSDVIQRLRADSAKDITGRSNTVNKPYPSTYTTGHSDGEGIEARQEALVVLGIENVQGGQTAQET